MAHSAASSREATDGCVNENCSALVMHLPTQIALGLKQHATTKIVHAQHQVERECYGGGG